MDARKLTITTFALGIGVTALVVLASPAFACTKSAGAAIDQYGLYGHAHTGVCPTGNSGSGDDKPGGGAAPAEVWIWKPICSKQDANLPGGQGLCTNLVHCPSGQTLMRHWRIKPLPRVSAETSCMPNEAADRPEITPALVLQAFRRIPLPRQVTHIQPAGKTLVNFDTIFYTDAQPFTRTITLLGQRVRLAIRPSSFRWVHGDGTTERTATGGAPYPAKTVLHRYQQAHVTVRAHVVVTWSARFSVNGSPMRPVPGTVTTVGPATPLRVAEASPALSGAGH